MCFTSRSWQELGQRLGERVLDAVRREEFHYRDIRIPATVSVGVAYLMPGETVPSWLERADRALYRAKECGRVNYVGLSKRQERSRHSKRMVRGEDFGGLQGL